MGAARPAAWAALALCHLFLEAGKPLVDGRLLLGRGDPADIFVPTEISEAVPGAFERGIGIKRRDEIIGCFVAKSG